MGAPILTAKDPIDGAVGEIVSAISALNMHPEPLENPIGNGEYLAERDKWAAHAVQHLEAALKYLRRSGSTTG